MAIRFPLSMNQEFVCLFDQGGETGPFGSRYHITAGWRAFGKLDIGALQGALDDIVVRHEALRTLVVRQDGSRYQEVYPGRPVKLIIRQLPGDNPAVRKREAEKLLSDVEADTISPREIPLFRCVLGQFDDEDSALALIVHHLAADGWSLEVIMRDVALRYAARCGHSVPALPEVRQYREHVAREQESSADETLQGSLAYWQERLRGGQIFTIRTDWPRSAGLMSSTSAHRFLIEPEAGSPILKLARSMRGSPFMVLLAAFSLLACQMSGTRDIVVPMFTPGRSGELFADAVGSFFNFLPVRTDLSGCTTFREVLQRTRAACVSAYSHDIAQAASTAPELMRPAFDERQATCVFQMISQLMPDGEKFGDLTYYMIRRQLDPQEFTTNIPDGMLWALRMRRDGEVFGDVLFKTNLFKADTADEMMAAYQRILRTTIANPDAPLDKTHLSLLYVQLLCVRRPKKSSIERITVTAPHEVFADLAEEGRNLDKLLVGLKTSQWALPTPAPGWTIAHQIGHLASVFSLAALAASNPEGFRSMAAGLSDDFDANVTAALAPYLKHPPDVLLARWRTEHVAAEEALGGVPPGTVVPWLVRPLPSTVLASAGMAELFGHGQDIADALGVRIERTDRIWHVAQFAVLVWDFGYLARGMTPPEVQFRYELTAPSGELWTLGSPDGTQRITGSAEDFCLLVTRRRHRDDLALTAYGPDASRWLDIAQAYRGSPGQGRVAGQFVA